MQKILFVRNDELEEVNKYLEDRWRVIDIKCTNEAIAHAFKGNESEWENNVYGNIYAYVVIQK